MIHRLPCTGHLPIVRATGCAFVRGRTGIRIMPGRGSGLLAVMVTIVLATVVIARPIAAQSKNVEAGFGVIVPGRGLGTNRSPGPLARLGFVIGDTARRARLRVDGEAAWMPGQSAQNNWRAYGLVVSALMGQRPASTGPYVIVGLAAQRIAVSTTPNPYGTLWGLRAGVGVQSPVGRTVFRWEATPHIVLSEYGTGRNYSFGSYWPVSVGFAF